MKILPITHELQDSSPSITRDHALSYLERGWCPIPVYHRSKEPIPRGWQNPGLVTKENINDHFGDQQNIGIVLGAASKGLVDIDIDAEDGLTLAAELLPPTQMKFGRHSRPESHWLYYVASPERLFDTSDENGKKIIEVRGDGHFTVFPPSVHPSGEDISFSEDKLPAESDWETLVQCAISISLAVVLRRHWKPGSRHKLALAISGYLARSALEADVARIISAVGQHADDPEVHDRLEAVATTFARHDRNEPTTGRNELVELLGPELVAIIDRWLIRGNKQPPIVPGDPGPIQNAITSDVDLAKYVAGKMTDTAIFCRSTNQWYQRKAQVWLPVADTDIQAAVIARISSIADVVAPLSSHAFSQRRQLLSRARIDSVEKLLRADATLKTDSKAFDRQPHLLGCSDGSVLNLETKSLVSSTDQIVTKQLGVSFDPSAQIPQWETFLKKIFNGDMTLMSFLQRAVGYSLTGEASERSLFLLIGNGANGKSTFLNVLRRLFGDYAGITPSHTLMSTQDRHKTDDLAALVGKRFVHAQESEANDRLAEAKIKMITGRDPITCRLLYGNYFTYDPQFVLWLATNEMPAVSGSADAVWERLRIIPFDVVIPQQERDLGLFDKLIEELPGILNWAIDGYYEWRKAGLNPPEIVLQTQSGYRQERDFVSQWIAQECTMDSTVHSQSGELYQAFSRWADENRHDSMNSNQFSRELERKGFKKVRTKSGMRWRGLCLASTEEFHIRAKAA